MTTKEINSRYALTPDQANDCDAVASQVLDDYVQENYPGLVYELYQDGVYPEGKSDHPATRELDAVYFEAYEKEAANSRRMKKKTPLNITVSEEARRLLTLHANRAGCSVSSLIERLIREEEERWNENLRRIAASTHMIQPK